MKRRKNTFSAERDFSYVPSRHLKQLRHVLSPNLPIPFIKTSHGAKPANLQANSRLAAANGCTGSLQWGTGRPESREVGPSRVQMLLTTLVPMKSVTIGYCTVCTIILTGRFAVSGPRYRR
jgi:hypothetical protein